MAKSIKEKDLAAHPAPPSFSQRIILTTDILRAKASIPTWDFLQGRTKMTPRAEGNSRSPSAGKSNNFKGDKRIAKSPNKERTKQTPRCKIF